MSKPIERDENRFRFLSDEPRAIIPEDAVMVLDFKTTTERIAERQAWYNSTVICECCKGLGRVAKTD